MLSHAKKLPLPMSLMNLTSPSSSFQLGSTTFESGHTSYYKYANLLCVRMSHAQHIIYTKHGTWLRGCVHGQCHKMTPILIINQLISFAFSFFFFYGGWLLLTDPRAIKTCCPSNRTSTTLLPPPPSKSVHATIRGYAML